MLDQKRIRGRNPFKVPDDREVLEFRADEQERKHREQTAIQDLYRHLREDPPTSDCDQTPTDQEPDLPEDEPGVESTGIFTNTRDFILQKREIYLSQLGIETKREELARLARLEREEEENLKIREDEIATFRGYFRTFLENDGKITMASRQAAEVKSKQRIELLTQIKQISFQISALRNEIAHHDEKLQECEDYQTFLESLTPKDWRKTHPPPEMYFTKPDQLLTLLATLEEQNMFLITHCQEADEVCDRFRLRFNELLESRDGAITDSVDRKARKERELREVDARNEQYRVTGDFRHGNELPESELTELQIAITEFHGLLGFDPASSNDTATMLSRIESKMEEMTDRLSRVDFKFLKELAQQKELQRRNQERTEKNIREKREQEEKTQKAIQLAMMPIKRRVGRPLTERIIPVKGQSRERKEEELRQKAIREAADTDLLYGAIWD
jgi:hypothetical protein